MDTLPVVEWLKLGNVYTLTSAITAFTISPDTQVHERGAPICELPENTDLRVCGTGFNVRTVKVSCGVCQYYVFWRDLASATIWSETATDEDAAW
jgi:hypothetical protein